MADAAKPVVVVDHDSLVFTILSPRKRKICPLDRLTASTVSFVWRRSAAKGISDETCNANRAHKVYAGDDLSTKVGW